MATYSGELRLPFDIQLGKNPNIDRCLIFACEIHLECNHVIDNQRTFITALSHGRNPNVKLRATYQNTDKFEFQVKELFEIDCDKQMYYLG